MARERKPIPKGERHYMLEATGRYEMRRSGKGIVMYCEMSCDCGNVVWIQKSNVRFRSKSCGCMRNDWIRGRGGPRNHPLHGVWRGMHDRCKQPDHISWAYYGGKGIEVCKDWSDFLPFYFWSLANGYKKGFQIDRISPDKDYSPENCRWISACDNSRLAQKKLNMERADEIRCLWSTGMVKQKTLSRWYGVGVSTIRNVIYGVRWA